MEITLCVQAVQFMAVVIVYKMFDRASANDRNQTNIKDKGGANHVCVCVFILNSVVAQYSN